MVPAVDAAKRSRGACSEHAPSRETSFILAGPLRRAFRPFKPLRSVWNAAGRAASADTARFGRRQLDCPANHRPRARRPRSDRSAGPRVWTRVSATMPRLEVVPGCRRVADRAGPPVSVNRRHRTTLPSA